MFHEFRGKKYRIKKVNPKNKDHYGQCDDPNEKYKTIEIPTDGRTRKDLDTIIHESIHASFWDLKEESVDEGAASIAKLLWRLGWRKVKEVK